ncbi:uncharacterized protein LOC132606398 isoform X2 [Lycium barbarum]|uniref:uncharacterized protein LOC132606398 isoform X2 n=1 Tax=Lycium barbarum TaxID=112863 RepID=UPI00293E2453|nr:uncharacterized protein LOC132606398 isoform X2 [Lycium barbarum]
MAWATLKRTLMTRMMMEFISSKDPLHGFFIIGSMNHQVNDPSELGKDDLKHKVDDVVLETDSILKESGHGDAMKQQRSTDSRTTSPPENLGFMNAAKKELDPEGHLKTWVSKKRRWRPNFLNKPEVGYDHAWLSGERRSKGRILLKGCGKDAKPGAITKKEVSQPTLVALEEFAVLEALEEKHEKDDKKNEPARYRDKRRRSSFEESGAELNQTALGSVFSITKESNFAKTFEEQCKRKSPPSQKEAFVSVSNTKESNFLKTSKEQRKRKSSPSNEECDRATLFCNRRCRGRQTIHR